MITRIIKTTSLFLVIQWLGYSCTTANNNSGNLQISNADSLPELSPVQETASDALNTIQVQAARGHLYSTFPGLQHSCFPPDTSFVISSAESRIAIEEILTNHGALITPEQQTKLAAEAVLGQEEYTVLQCIDYLEEQVDDLKTGTWILPEVLGRRDVILVW